MFYDIAISILSNYVFDFSKSYLNNRFEREVFVNNLHSFLPDFTDSIVDSGVFQDFLYLPETEMDFRNFIEYGTYQDKIEQSDITKEQFLEVITNKATNYVIYNRNEDLRMLSFEELKAYFKALIMTIEKTIIASLDKKTKYSNYLHRIKLEELTKKLLYSPSHADIAECDAKNIKQLYMKMVSTKYQTVHIYGIEDLTFDQFYIKPSFSIIIDENSKVLLNTSEYWTTIKWPDIFANSNIISIIGGAGFGKTLFLKNIMNDFKLLKVAFADQMVPIYCDLKRFAEAIKKNMSYTITEFLVDSMKYDSSIKEINMEFLNFLLNKGQCLILFDALDEVDSFERTNIHSIIVNFFESVNNNNKVCITSRERGFIPKTDITLRVNPVDKVSIEAYIDKLIKIKKFKSDYKEKFVSECQKLIDKRFIESFLMLSLLVNVYKSERKMPRNKIDLYNKAVQYISKDREMGEIDGEAKKSKFNFDLMQSILEYDVTFETLALLAKPNNKDVSADSIKHAFISLHNENYSDRNKLLLAIKEFLKFCTERTELFIKSTESSYRFYHKSFFEYFYAKYMLNTMNYEELIQEIGTFDVSQEIPEMLIELMKAKSLTQYKLFVDYFLKSLQNKTIGFEESFNLLLLINEPGYLSRILNIFFEIDVFGRMKLPTKSSDSSVVRNPFVRTEFPKLISKIFGRSKIHRDTIRNNILRYYKIEYLKLLYVNYITKSERSVNLEMDYEGNYLWSLNAIQSYVGNVFTPGDFSTDNLNQILRDINISSERNDVLSQGQRETVIQMFHNYLYLKPTSFANLIESESTFSDELF